MNLFYLLANSTDLCNTLKPIMTLIGYVIYGIKVVVPVILILVGMMDLAKAIMGKDDSEIKKAQSSLIKKIVVAVCVYLVITIVGLVMGLLGQDQYESCVGCAFDPFAPENQCCVIDCTTGTTTSGGYVELKR